MFPHLRTAIWATQLTGTSFQDGFAKTLGVGDIAKLKSPNMRAQLLLCEKQLHDAWTVISHGLGLDSALAIKCYGRMNVRSILLLTKKEKFSREKKSEYESLQAIMEAFVEELANPPSTHNVAQAKPKAMPVANLVEADAKTMALHQNTHIQLGNMHLIAYFGNAFVLVCAVMFG